MHEPQVSVLMTSYNREKYIGAAIESVLASSFTDFELVVVDDCSKDRTQEIVKEYATKDPRIKLFINGKNLGQFANRNLAATYATGKYLKYLDSDDLIYPTGLEVLVGMMEQFPDAGYGLCSLEQDNERIFPYMLTPAEAYERHFLQGAPIFHKAPLSSIIRKEAFFEVGGFTNPAGEGDYEMWLSLSVRHKVVLMPAGVVWYRIHAEQIDQQRRTDPFLRFKYFLVTLRYLQDECPLDAAKADLVRKKTHHAMTRFILTGSLRHSPAKTMQMFRAAKYTPVSLLKAILTGGLGKLNKQ